MTAKHLTNDATSVESTEDANARPQRDQVVTAIVRDFNGKWGQGACTAGMAEKTLQLIELLAERSRSIGEDWVFLTRQQMDTMQATVMRTVFPQGVPTEANSAADIVNRYIVDTSMNELGLMHNDIEPNSVEYCAVRMAVRVVSGQTVT